MICIEPLVDKTCSMTSLARHPPQGPPNIDAIACLVVLGARLSTLEQHGSLEPPLHIAARSGRLDMVQTLLRCGVDVRSRAKVPCSNPVGIMGIMPRFSLGHLRLYPGLNL